MGKEVEDLGKFAESDEPILVFDGLNRPVFCTKSIKPLCKEVCRADRCVLEKDEHETPELFEVIQQFRRYCESLPANPQGPVSHSRVFLSKEGNYTIRCVRLKTEEGATPAWKIILHQALLLHSFDFDIVDRKFGLTKVELNVLKDCLEGLSPMEIAEKYSIGRETVKTHMHNIFGKLGITRRTQLLSKLI